MKLLLTFFLFIAAFYLTRAQDTIVTSQGDTIECRITRVADQFIHFSVFDKSGNLLLRSRLPLSQVKTYNQTAIEPDETPPEEEGQLDIESIIDEYQPPKFRLSAYGGFSYQFGGYEGLPKSYTSQLQSLWNLGGEFHFFPIDELGIGVKYTRVSTTADQEFEPPFSTIFGFSSLQDEKLRFTYTGLSIAYRNILYDDQYIHYYVSGGMVNYRSDFLADGTPLFQEGETFAFTLGVSYDYVLAKSFGIGVGIEFTIARLSELNNNGFQVPADFDISRIDISLGLRFLK